MKKFTTADEAQSLNNFLRNAITKNPNIIIIQDQILGKRHALAEVTDSGTQTLSNFMAYEEMNCYFFGMMMQKKNEIKFKTQDNEQ